MIAKGNITQPRLLLHSSLQQPLAQAWIKAVSGVAKSTSIIGSLPGRLEIPFTPISGASKNQYM